MPVERLRENRLCACLECCMLNLSLFRTFSKMYRTWCRNSIERHRKIEHAAVSTKDRERLTKWWEPNRRNRCENGILWYSLTNNCWGTNCQFTSTYGYILSNVFRFFVEDELFKKADKHGSVYEVLRLLSIPHNCSSSSLISIPLPNGKDGGRVCATTALERGRRLHPPWNGK